MEYSFYKMTLAEAASDGNANVVQQLLAQTTHNINNENNSLLTPLMSASLFGHTEVVRLLLSHGADINHQNTYGTTALRLAAVGDNVEVVRELLKHGADTTLKHWLSGDALSSTRDRVLSPNSSLECCTIFTLIQEHIRQPLTTAESFFSGNNRERTSSNASYQQGFFLPKTVVGIMSDYANPFSPSAPGQK
jgi:ankyrin repeat protein